MAITGAAGTVSDNTFRNTGGLALDFDGDGAYTITGNSFNGGVASTQGSLAFDGGSATSVVTVSNNDLNDSGIGLGRPRVNVQDNDFDYVERARPGSGNIEFVSDFTSAAVYDLNAVLAANDFSPAAVVSGRNIQIAPAQ